MAITHEKMRDLIVTVNYMISRCVSEPEGLSNEHYNNCGAIKDILHEAAQPTAQERKGCWHEFATSQFMGCDGFGNPKYRDGTVYRHDECGFNSIIKHNYCPRCGARMDGEPDA